MDTNALRHRVLREALKRVGDYDELAERLGVSRTLLDRWLKRAELIIPNRVFLTAVDILDGPPATAAWAEADKPVDIANKRP